MIYIIDRFEGSLAILQDEQAHNQIVNRDVLPVDAIQGDIVKLEDGKFFRDLEETARRRTKMRSMEQLLKKRQ